MFSQSIVSSQLAFVTLFCCLTASAQSGMVRGRLIAEDTGLPIANAVIVATASTRYASRITVTTGTDGGFSLPTQRRAVYGVCARSPAPYVDTCQIHSRKVYSAEPAAEPFSLVVPVGIPARVTIEDPNHLVAISTESFLSANPLDLHVYIEESVTRTHVPVPITKVAADSIQFFVTVPAGSTWRLAANSVRFSLVDGAGRPYMVDSPIPTSSRNSDGEAVVSFSIRRK